MKQAIRIIAATGIKKARKAKVVDVVLLLTRLLFTLGMYIDEVDQGDFGRQLYTHESRARGQPAALPRTSRCPDN